MSVSNTVLALKAPILLYIHGPFLATRKSFTKRKVPQICGGPLKLSKFNVIQQRKIEIVSKPLLYYVCLFKILLESPPKKMRGQLK